MNLRKGRVAAAVACVLAAGAADANPTGPAVVAGQASFVASGRSLNISNSSGAIIQWQGFSIGAAEITRFIQPSAASSVLNRVVGSDPSLILGTLVSNGKVFLINPSGILVGEGARIDVAGLVASTLGLSNRDFLAGRFNFSSDTPGHTVENRGGITTPTGGSVYLVGSSVANSGIIRSAQGEVVLAAGQSVRVFDSGTPGVRVEVTAGAAGVNLGEMLARSGQVGIYGALLAAGSSINVDALDSGNGGRIVVLARGETSVAGTLSARGGANSGDGGFIETSGKHVVVADSARVNTLAPHGATGLWLLDPVNYVIGATGDETPGSVTVSLATSNRLISASNDITVADALVWTSAQTLELSAGHDVRVNAAITASTAGAAIVLTAGNDVRVNSPMTASGGGAMVLRANHDVLVNNVLTADTGLDAVVLRADNDGSGPGAAGGTVSFSGLGAVITPRTLIRFNPDGYAATGAETTDYQAKVSALLDARAWVFAKADDKVYDGTTAAVLSFKGTPTDAGVVTLVPGTADFDTRNAATGKTVTYAGYSLGGGDAGKFELFSGAGAATAAITPKALTAIANTTSKIYDGDTTATPTLSITAGLVGTETVGATGTATFNSKDVLAANLVTVNSTALADGTNGGLASNYSLASGQTVAGTISAKALTASVTAPSKVYNGDATATPTLSITAGLVGTETVSATGTATFNSKDVLAANLVTVSSTALADGTNGGLASNYSLAAGQTVADTISAKALTASVTAPSKVYNGDATAAPTLSITAGLVGTETVGATGTATFNSKDVLAANLVTVNSTALADGTNGGLASNYSLAAGQTVAGTITPKALSASVTAPSKVYNGDATATPTLSITAGLVGTETVSATGTATFNSKDVLAANLVTVNSTALADGSNGGLASNYSLASGQTVADTITPKALSASVTAPSKVYNGDATATPTLGITAGLVGTETVGATGTATFNSKDVLAANLVTVNSTALADGTNGGLASNYSLAAGQTVADTITPKALSASVTAPSKVYNGDATATPTLSITAGLVGTETVSATGTATFNSKDVLAANLVTVNSTALADGTNGGLASNYSLAAGQTVADTITPKALSASVTAPSKVYNGDATATPTLSITAGLVGTETVGATGTATFNSKDVLAANLVTVNSTALADGTNGGLASNYSLAAGQTVADTITPKALSASVTAPSKVYNGDATATPTLSITAGLVGTETVSATGTATFNSKDVLAANLVTVNSTALADGTNGGLASNYSLASGQTVADTITPKALTAGVTAPSKVYNGDATAAPTLSITAGLVGTETVSATGTATFNSKDVLAANLVTVNSTALADGTNGGLASNYSLASGQTVADTITAKALTASVTAPSKVYNGDATATPTLSITAGLVGSETVSATGTATFNSKDVLAANLVTVNSTALADGSNGGLASNYSLTSGQTVADTISTAPLTVVANAGSKVFGTADPALTFVTTGLVLAETAGGVLSGALTRAAGESVLGGPYAITQGSLAASSNYTLGFTASSLVITGAAVDPAPGFNLAQVVFSGVINNQTYYRPGNFWHVSLNANNADPGFDVMRGTDDLSSLSRRASNSCDSVFGGGFCETWSFPQQLERP